MDDLLNQITGLTASQRKKLHSWVASLPEEMILKIFQNGVKISFQLKDELPNIAGKISKYCAFILSARKAGWDSLKGKGYRVAGEKQFEDFSYLRKSKAADLNRKGRKPNLKKKILAYWGEIVELKKDGKSYRDIVDYLKINRKIKTSPSYLLQLWKETQTND